MMSKKMKYFAGAVIVGIVIYNSLYFRALDEKLAEGKKVAFDAQSFVDSMWSTDLLAVYDSATEITTLLNGLKENPDSMFDHHAQTLGIGNVGCFKVGVEGTVLSVNENNVLLQVSDRTVEIETEFIFGNSVRDASGLIKVNDFDETSDFNSISESINDKIRKEVIPDFRSNIKKGDKVSVKGALELNKAHLNLSQLEVIPVSIQIIQ